MALRNILFENIAFCVDDRTNVFFNDGNGNSVGPFWDLFENGQWEYDALVRFLRLISRPGIVIDIGAWIGPYAMLSLANGHGVACFEPDPEARMLLNMNMQASGQENFIVSDKAIAPQAGTTKLFSNQFGDSESSVARRRIRNGRELFAEQSIEVSAIDLNEAASHLGSDPISTVKMDVEGSEYALLEQVFEFISNRKCNLLMQFHPDNSVGVDLSDISVFSKIFRSHIAKKSPTTTIKWGGVWRNLSEFDAIPDERTTVNNLEFIVIDQIPGELSSR